MSVAEPRRYRRPAGYRDAGPAGGHAAEWKASEKTIAALNREPLAQAKQWESCQRLREAPMPVAAEGFRFLRAILRIPMAGVEMSHCRHRSAGRRTKLGTRRAIQHPQASSRACPATQEEPQRRATFRNAWSRPRPTQREDRYLLGRPPSRRCSALMAMATCG